MPWHMQEMCALAHVLLGTKGRKSEREGRTGVGAGMEWYLLEMCALANTLLSMHGGMGLSEGRAGVEARREGGGSGICYGCVHWPVFYWVPRERLWMAIEHNHNEALTYVRQYFE